MEAQPKLTVVPPPDVLHTLKLRDVEMRSIVWLDKPLILNSAFTLVAGPKGVGKGTWLASQIAQMTTGQWGQPRNVLVISSEDSASVDLRPRCEAAGADTTRVILVADHFTLPKDAGKLYRTAENIGDVGMIVIDPVGNHLNGADTDRESHVRHAIGDLNRLADKLACAVFGVRHVGKNRERGALGAVLGSTAWVDLPRCVLMFAPDDEDDMIFHVQVVAGNRAGRSNGRSYHIDLAPLPGLLEPVTRASIVGESTKDVEDLLQVIRRTSKSQNAREVILDILDQEGRQESEAFDARIAHLAGVTAKTVRNLRGELKNQGLVKAVPEKDPDTQMVSSWWIERTKAPRPSARVDA